MSEGQRIPYHPSALPVDGARGVLVVAPHPDDEVFGCGGCAALYADAGIPVRSLILTDGGLGGVQGEDGDLVATRYQEVICAAAVLGYGVPIFGGYPDRSLQDSIPAVADLIVEQMNATGADVLFAPSLWEMHPDHSAAAHAAVLAIKQLGDGYMLVQYEVGVPLLPNRLVDITPVHTQKQLAMKCFVSQLAVQAYDRHITSLNVFRTYTLAPGIQAAEGVRVATAAEADEDPFGLVFEGNAHPLHRHIAPPVASPKRWYSRWLTPRLKKQAEVG